MTVLSPTGGRQLTFGLSPDELEQMRRLWEGAPELTATAIAAEFGVTKNTVIGHRYRRGWKMRRPATREPTTMAQRLGAIATFPPTGRCVYPRGEPRKEGFRFCGEHVTEVGSPYCEDHDKLCRQGEASKRRMEEWEDDPERHQAAVTRRIVAQRGVA